MGKFLIIWGPTGKLLGMDGSSWGGREKAMEFKTLEEAGDFIRGRFEFG